MVNIFTILIIVHTLKNIKFLYLMIIKIFIQSNIYLN